MIRDIVIDAACLIDVRKGGLLVALRDRAYRLVIPAPVRISEVLDSSGEHWRYLDDRGMITHDLTPREVKTGAIAHCRISTKVNAQSGRK